MKTVPFLALPDINKKKNKQKKKQQQHTNKQANQQTNMAAIYMEILWKILDCGESMPMFK